MFLNQFGFFQRGFWHMVTKHTVLYTSANLFFCWKFQDLYLHGKVDEQKKKKARRAAARAARAAANAEMDI